MEGFPDMASESMEFKVRELLKEVQLDYTPSLCSFIEDSVSIVRDVIDGMPEDLQVTAESAPGFVRDIGADKVNFIFKKPKSVTVGGSYSIRELAKPDVSVDVFIRLPKECFREKDYLNHRYHAKRCLYLSVMKKHLMLSSLVERVEWSALQNEARKPILVVYPAKEAAQLPGFSVRIIPAATSLFNIAKLNLERNNIRAYCRDGALLPTPIYNSSILEDMFLEENSELVKRTFCGWKALGDALVLLKVWARQRSSIYVHDCINGFLLSVILSYLATQDKINKSMKALEIFRVTLDFIATSKLWDRGIHFPPQGRNGVAKEGRSKLRELFPVILFDLSTQVNLAFRISSVGFQELQDEASLALKCMEKSGDCGFEEIFMTKVDYPVKFDLCVRLNCKGNTRIFESGFCMNEECWRTYERKVHSLLSQGLGDRTKLIRVIWKNSIHQWNVEDGFSVLDEEPLFVGIMVSSAEKAFRMVDIGPIAENKAEALRFQEFWGDKAELRRFKDGRIAESTVWESQQWTRHLILKSIVEHVLMRHLSLSKENIFQTVDQLDFSLQYFDKDPLSFSGALLGAFEVLSKLLREVDDIPLKVSNVQPLDSAFRSTSVFPPEPHPLASVKVDARGLNRLTPLCVQAMDVMIQLEGSGNWPMDDVAIEKTKAAFLLRIAESLQDKWGVSCTATEDDVDVFVDGYAFRLRILHERGLSLVKRDAGNDPAKRVSTTDRMLFLRSHHASMIGGLQGRFPVYGSVVRLAKRWVAAHLFSNCLEEEAIELLVAYIFLKPLPLTVPYSRITGFLRFLRLLADYDWTFSPLIVDINSDLSRSDEKEINDTFLTSRKAYEEDKEKISAAMFLATSYDKASEAWTRCSPNLLELKRLVAYARSSDNLMTSLMLSNQTDKCRWECLLRTPLSNYDAVLLLHREKLSYPQRLLFPSELNQGKHVVRGKASKHFSPFLLSGDLKKKSTLEELKSKLLVNFDPLACFTSDVGEKYASLKLWYDALGGDAIGITWERPLPKKREREDMDEESNPVEILRSVGEMGKGLVRDVYLLKSPRIV